MRLQRSDPGDPGLARRRCGKGFTYTDPSGRRVTDPETLERVRQLTIPPAWHDVWICPSPTGHLQAVGVDDAGRRQYLYHPDWRVRRDRQKFARATVLGTTLPRLRGRLASRLEQPGLTQERVLSAAVRLVDLGLFRAGGEQYARANGSFGLATALREHVSAVPGGFCLSFQAKSGVVFTQEVRDPHVCRVLKALVRRDDPSEQLLAWWSPADRTWHPVRSELVNAFVREVAAEDLTVKDFRTWHASVLMAMKLAGTAPPATKAQRRRVLVEAYGEVAEVLHNTPAVTRSSYVDPRVVDLWRAGAPLPRARSGTTELVPLGASRALTRLLG